MKKITLGALALLTIATACRDDSYSLPAKSSTNLVTPTLHTRVNGSQSPLTGIVEAYPCLEGSSIYFGNYVNNTLSVFYGFYNVLDGNITGDYNREVSLPVGNYNIVYWGTPKYEEPIHTTPAIVEPGLTLGADLSQLYFSLRKNSQDTTYIPVYDMVHVNKEVIIGPEDLEANMNRVVAGLKVIVKTKNNAVINSNITDIKVLIGGIAEKLNLYTAEPSNMTKTVQFNLVRSTDNTEMSNAMVMLFPSAPNPLLTLVITLKDGSVHTLSKNLVSTLTANTRLTVNIVIGDIFAGGSSGKFTIENWNEANETIEFPVVD